ncbi:BTB/POZ domain-containing protein 17-like [Lingula anatina]|uniref:BTB/POZ domain-containing protein 17-like n=1 Tax=Lingula anatina TaxID=7574 RepID=A0A1S3H8N8_LINAN|nr:BTB/POZ domain-containing protein 17-like [Lingula anatina]|eukprot:XP_013382450.1 BTB/POZ domain-containing protein 17-like [Lingula anatina]
MAGLPPSDLQLVDSTLDPTAGEFSAMDTSSFPELSTSSCSSYTLSPEGTYCYGNERKALADQTRFFNSEILSDVILKVGEQTFYAHKLILIKTSDVFERMFSSGWSEANSKCVELVEEGPCIEYFARFLKFLYGCQIILSKDSCLPVLVLADKYNVADLKNVCVSFACSSIIPKLQLKQVFHTWFQYATKCDHKQLVSACILALSEEMSEIMLSGEWQREWEELDKNQLIEILKSSDLCVTDEYEVWQAVLAWVKSPQKLERRENYLKEILQYVRFPMMTPDQLYSIEKHVIAETYGELFQEKFIEAYRYHALSISKRADIKLFTNSNYLLRNYTSLRWDKRLKLQNYGSCPKFSEHSLKFSTRSSSFPTQTWDWELRVYPKGFSQTSDDFRCLLYSNLLLDQPRPVEFMVSVVNNTQILCTVTGKKNFSKNRYTVDTEIDKQISVFDLESGNSPYLMDGSLVFQVTLQPVM